MLRLLLLSLLLTVPGVRAPAQADPFEPSVTREESEWIRAAVATATTEATTPTADYLMGMPHLAENLEAGLDALGVDVSGEEEDFL